MYKLNASINPTHYNNFIKTPDLAKEIGSALITFFEDNQ